MQHGQPLVFDMDYEQFMRNQDKINTAEQLMMAYSANRLDKDPYHFMFTNMDPQGEVFKALSKCSLIGEYICVLKLYLSLRCSFLLKTI